MIRILWSVQVCHQMKYQDFRMQSSGKKTTTTKKFFFPLPSRKCQCLPAKPLSLLSAEISNSLNNLLLQPRIQTEECWSSYMMKPTDRASLNESLAGGKLAGIENLISVTPSFLNNWSHRTKHMGKGNACLLGYELAKNCLRKDGQMDNLVKVSENVEDMSGVL